LIHAVRVLSGEDLNRECAPEPSFWEEQIGYSVTVAEIRYSLP
jgi:hypothetical protein